MNIMRAFKLRLRIFAGRQDGSMPVEGVMASTFLIWWYISSFQFFDVYRQKNINLKAAYTISDMLSRETGPVVTDPTSVPVNQTYINGLNTVFDYLTYSRKPTWVRATSLYWDADDSKYRVDWSAASGTGHQVLNTISLQAYANRIPKLTNGDTVIMVETFMAYEPMFSMGLKPTVFNTMITTSPRFSSCVPWNTLGCGLGVTGAWVNPDLADPDTTP